MDLTIGCNFTEAHIDAILYLTKLKGYNKIKYVYGSPGQINPFGSVRPAYREQSPTWETFTNGVKRLQQAGIKTCLTFNSLSPESEKHSLLDSSTAQNKFLEFVHKVRGLVDYWIVAHPGVVDLLLNLDKKTKVIISTVMNVHTLGQLVWIKENWPNVERVCPALEKNKDMDWLFEANKILQLDLLVNEFCSMAGNECEGLYRQACYLAQSMNLDWDAKKICIRQRNLHPEAWIASNYILPQWLDFYFHATGVNTYKVTGRTHPAAFIRKVGEYYIKGFMPLETNLLELWGQLEATLKGAKNQTKIQRKTTKRVVIPIKKLEHLCYVRSSDLNNLSYCRELWQQIKSEQETKGEFDGTQ